MISYKLNAIIGITMNTVTIIIISSSKYINVECVNARVECIECLYIADEWE